MFRRTASLLVGALALFLDSVPASAQRYHVHHYGEADGLPSSTVHGVAQGPDGRMWFATRVGVASYDGRAWRTYGRAEGLVELALRALIVDDDGIVWTIGRHSPGHIGRNDGSGWTDFNPGQWPKGGPATNLAVQVVGGDTWLVAAVKNEGLYVTRYERERSTAAAGNRAQWRKVSAETEILALEAIGNRFAVGTPTGLFVMDLDDAALSLHSIEAAGDDAVIGIASEATTGRIWIVGRDWLGILDGDDMRLVVEDHPFSPYRDDPAVATQLDRVGGLFFGNHRAIWYFHPSTGLESIGVQSGLGSHGATAFALDREDNLWIASLRGVSKIVSRRFAGFNHDHGLLVDEVSAVYERRDGGVVLGHPGGLTFFSEGRRTLALGNEHQLRVMDMVEDDSGTLWIAAGGSGLIRMRPGIDPEPVPLDDDGASVFAVVIDRVGTIWVGTSRGLFRGGPDGFRRVGSDTPFIRRLIVGHDGLVYVATPGQGLLRVEHDRLELFAKSETPAANSLYSMHEDDAGSMLVGTDAGLFRVVDGWMVKSIAPGPVVDHPVYFITTDARGRYWFGTDHGVVRQDGRRRDSFSVRDGLIGAETNRAAGLLDSSGQLWIGTNRGVSVYRPLYDAPRRTMPEVRLTDIEAGGESLPLTRSQRLEAGRNALLFRFSATSFVDESRVRFRYRLEGFDDEWVGPQLLPTWELRYSRVPPGEYRLRLQAVDAEGRRSVEAVSAPIVILRPVWLRLWFLALVAAAALGLLFGVVGYISQRRYSRRLEREVRERTRELSKAQKLEALGLLAGGIAHDFNNLLTVVLGNLALSRGKDDRSAAARLARARAATEQAQRLTRQLLTFSSGGAPIRQAASVAQLIHESTSFALSGSDASLEIDLSEDLWVVDIDEDQMSQVIGNLLLNARQASSAGGKIRVSARNVAGAPALLPEGRYVVVEVEDDGSGIPREHLDRIFDPYFTTKDSGSGLGLATAYSIVSRHDGRLTVESTLGRGSLFRIYLPAPAGVVRVAPLPADAQQPPPGAGRVLVMDDDRAVRAITREMLEEYGYVVDEAAEGRGAVDRYREAAGAGEPYDVVIMDLTVPGGMGGKEAIGRLLELDPAATAVVVSGYSNDPVMAQHRDFGFAACLGKPFTPELLARTLERVLREKPALPGPA